MAHCVSYAKPTDSLYRSCAASPYDDWRRHRRRRPSVVVFQHERHWIDSDMYIYFQPVERRVCIYLAMDYFSFEMKATLAIDDVGRTIGVDRIYCENDNFWPELNGQSKATPVGGGGIAVYKRNLQYLSPCYDVSLENVAALFFGGGWTALPLPMTRPRLPRDVSTQAEMMRFFDDYAKGPWHATIGKFVPDEDASAVVIQKCFRGWRARRAYAFDPHTTLGKYYALRLFSDMIKT